MRLIAIAMMFWGSVAMMFHTGSTGGLVESLGLFSTLGAGGLFLVEYLREIRSEKREV